MSEEEVNITKNKRLLEAIRKEKEKQEDVSTQSGSGVGGGYAAGSNNSNRQDAGRTKSGDTRTERGTERTERGTSGSTQVRGDAPGIREGIRQTDRQSEYASQGFTPGDRRREKEPITFRLKGLFNSKPQEPPKLFSKVEAEAEYEKLYDVYFYGSGLLDDVLEITVKGHEPVQIWQLDPDEAETLAKMHLQRATYDKKAAASARQLIALYDRLYFWLLAGPRCKATYTHVKIHGGFSFR